jgi:5-methylcytosine-specific restriction endonuclease McrA
MSQDWSLTVDKYKVCRACKQNLPATSFYKHNKHSDQLRPSCKPCYNQEVKLYRQVNCEKRNAYQRAWHKKNPDKAPVYRQAFAQRRPESVKKSQAKYSRNNPEYIRFKSAKRRALKLSRGVFRITQKEFFALYRMPCFYCGGKSEHVDHVVPLSRGGRHSIGNLVASCASCNLSKSDRFITEWKTALKNERGKT